MNQTFELLYMASEFEVVSLRHDKTIREERLMSRLCTRLNTKSKWDHIENQISCSSDRIRILKVGMQTLALKQLDVRPFLRC